MKGLKVKRVLGVLVAALFMVACVPPVPSAQTEAQQAALNKAREAAIYANKNHIELDNYNKRQQISDNPATILWCTSSFPQPNSPMFTVPIVGKLTSGGKRPYPTTISRTYYQSTSEYFPELPGPDGMYGSSGEYRYGFDPSGNYVDFYDIATFCTTNLTVFQRQSTTVMLAQDGGVNAAQTQAQAILAGCGDKCTAADKAKATQILIDALGKK